MKGKRRMNFQTKDTLNMSFKDFLELMMKMEKLKDFLTEYRDYMYKAFDKYEGMKQEEVDQLTMKEILKKLDSFKTKEKIKGYIA